MRLNYEQFNYVNMPSDYYKFVEQAKAKYALQEVNKRLEKAVDREIITIFQRNGIEKYQLLIKVS